MGYKSLQQHCNKFYAIVGRQVFSLWIPNQLRGIGMKTTKRNFWLDVIIFIALIATTITGFNLWLFIPHKLDIIFLGLSRSIWINVHIWFGVMGLAGIVLHIVWHWGWLKALRWRPLNGMPKKVRTNRVIN